MNNINSLKGIIKLLSKRTAMYTGGHSIQELRAFLHGWMAAKEGQLIDADLLHQFTEWLKVEYDVKGGQSWDKIVAFQASDEYHALAYFFEDFDRFLSGSK